MQPRPDLILAPPNLGLRPPKPDKQRGAWASPEALRTGEREDLRRGVGYGDIVQTDIRRPPLGKVLKQGPGRTVPDGFSPVAGLRRAA